MLKLLLATAVTFVSITGVAAPTGPKYILDLLEDTREKVEILFALAETEEVITDSDQNMSGIMDLNIVISYMAQIVDPRIREYGETSIEMFACSAENESVKYCKVDFTHKEADSYEPVNITFTVTKKDSKIVVSDVKKVDGRG